MLHFAYGTNMSDPLMRARCPRARPLGAATLSGWRFIINADGLPSIVRQSGSRVHGILWDLSIRDVAAVNAYEGVQCGLYRPRLLPVRHAGAHLKALVYIGRGKGAGIARVGYMKEIVDAALGWNLPATYIRSLARRSPGGSGCRARDTGELGSGSA
jgi:hypothetical protein